MDAWCMEICWMVNYDNYELIVKDQEIHQLYHVNPPFILPWNEMMVDVHKA